VEELDWRRQLEQISERQGAAAKAAVGNESRKEDDEA
jgi:hypothetical protein